jgi:hypothetical protein
METVDLERIEEFFEETFRQIEKLLTIRGAEYNNTT